MEENKIDKIINIGLIVIKSIFLLLTTWFLVFKRNSYYSPVNNIFSALFVVIFFHVLFYDIIIMVYERKKFIKLNYKIISFILFIIVLSLFGFYSNYWSQDVRENNENDTYNSFTLTDIIKFPFEQYQNSVHVKDQFFCTDTTIKKSRYLILLDKTPSVASTDSIISGMISKTVTDINDTACSGSDIVNRNLDNRDKLLLKIISEIYSRNKSGFEFQCYLYFGDKSIYPLADDGSHSKFISISSENYCRILQDLGNKAVDLEKKYSKKGVKTDLTFALDFLARKQFNVDSTEYNTFSFISDFDNDEKKDANDQATFDKATEAFFVNNSFQNVAVLNLIGITANTVNQDKWLGGFENNISTNSRQTNEMQCRTNRNYDDYIYSLREVIKGPEIVFQYPKMDSKRIRVGKCRLNPLNTVSGSFYVSDLDPSLANRGTYLAINAGNASGNNTNYKINQNYPFTFSKNEKIDLDVHQNTFDKDKYYFLNLSPRNTRYTYQYELCFKEYLPNLSALFLQLSYFIVLILSAFIYGSYMVVIFMKLADKNTVSIPKNHNFHYVLFALFCFLLFIVILKVLILDIFIYLNPWCYIMGTFFIVSIMLILDYKQSVIDRHKLSLNETQG